MLETGELALIDLGHMAARLGKTSIPQKQWMAKIGERAQAAVEKVEKVARKAGLSHEAVQTIRREILGISQ